MSKPLYSLDAIEYVHKHNGLVVLAHPWCYKQPDEIIKSLVEYCLYLSHLDILWMELNVMERVLIICLMLKSTIY